MKIRVVHILIDTYSERERKSIESMSKLSQFDIEYIPYITKRYTNDVWKIQQPIDGWKRHSSSHYGAYLSFKDVVLRYFTEDLDAFMVLESDCVLSDNIGIEFFKDEIINSINFSKKHNIFMFSFGNRYYNNILQSPILYIDSEYPHFCKTNKIILTHCVLFPKHIREILLYEYIHSNWDAVDIFHNKIFSKYTQQYSMGITTKPYTFQNEGVSHIDNIFKLRS
jgi:hypothetical protein